MSKDAALERFSEVAGIAIGEASTCWSELPRGEFDTARAIAALERIKAAAVAYREEYQAADLAERRAVADKVRPLREKDLTPAMMLANMLKGADDYTEVFAVAFTGEGEPQFWGSGEMSLLPLALVVLQEMALNHAYGLVEPFRS